MACRLAHPADRRLTGSATIHRGLTLIELLVSVGVLAIMILAFNLVLVPSQRLVSKSTTTMKVNNAAAAISDLLRDDLRQASQKGFLCITWGNDTQTNELHPRLVFTAPGPARSLTSDVQGAGRLVCVGVIPDSYLWRQGWIVPSLWAGDQAEQFDVVIPDGNNPYHDMAFLESLPRYDTGVTWDIARIVLGDLLYTDQLNPQPGPPDFTGSPEQWQWQVLAERPVALSVMWTDGTLDGDNNLHWYGIEYTLDDNGSDELPAPDDVGYTIEPEDSDWEDNDWDDDETEYEHNGHYWALWTHENQRNWPTAIKIRYTLNVKDDSSRRTLNGVRGFRQVTYEVICPLGS